MRAPEIARLCSFVLLGVALASSSASPQVLKGARVPETIKGGGKFTMEAHTSISTMIGKWIAASRGNVK